jgi:hypothetical protein
LCGKRQVISIKSTKTIQWPFGYLSCNFKLPEAVFRIGIGVSQFQLNPDSFFESGKRQNNFTPHIKFSGKITFNCSGTDLIVLILLNIIPETHLLW